MAKDFSKQVALLAAAVHKKRGVIFHTHTKTPVSFALQQFIDLGTARTLKALNAGIADVLKKLPEEQVEAHFAENAHHIEEQQQ